MKHQKKAKKGLTVVGGKDLKKGTLKGKTHSKANCPACHPELELGGGAIVGARCGNPRTGYDIYIGLDQYSFKLTPTAYPWESDSEVIQFCYPIKDMSVPTNHETFHSMIVWMAEMLSKGKRIHIGCIGGHGRTGLVLAALKAHVDGDTEAGAWVRKQHCSHAIETDSQVDYLLKHYGISKVSVPKKSWGGNWGGYKSQSQGNLLGNSSGSSSDSWYWDEYAPLKNSELEIW